MKALNLQNHLLSWVQAAMSCLEHLIQSVKTSRGKSLRKHRLNFKCWQRKSDGTCLLNFGIIIFDSWVRRQRERGWKDTEMGMTAEDDLVFSDQRHRLSFPKCGHPPPGCGCLQCSLPVDRKKGFLFHWCQSHGRIFKNKHPSKVGETCLV